MGQEEAHDIALQTPSQRSSKGSVQDKNGEDEIKTAHDGPRKDLIEPEKKPGVSTAMSKVQEKTQNPSKRTKALRFLSWVIKDQWQLLIMGMLILIASQVQVPAAQQRKKRTVVTYLSVSVIFFINGCTLETRILLQNYKRWKIHLFVQLQCFLMCSAATFALVSLCALNPNFMDPWLLVGFLVLGCAPTTMSSNVVMTRQAHGNTALTVVQSVIGQFLCPFLTPIILQMYLSSGAWYGKVLSTATDNYGEIYRRVFMQLGLSLFVPILAGQVVQYFFPKQTKKVFFGWKLIKLSSIALLTLVWQTFDQAFQTGAFTAVASSNIIFTVFVCIALYFLWLAICFPAAVFWMPKKDVIACCYCCPAKALAMVVPLTSVMYIDISPIEQSKMQLPAIMFQAFQVSIGGLLTIAFRRWIRREEEQAEREKNLEAALDQ
ncbi:hypothetical protein P153DRAFT_364484 [Dothidotthia symphoricarpi CBS 119687]|uniref:Sodium bile acid symporter family protein n=1 Tax=Dothidotthia symphoricarpi CBS 119687 TaxID=1392245 RepID=A0A6A6ANG1_9PLEO|nr:uncharacterized protein P153DRAFT_364484 [Dothidotthia symphoricarpi CBS 119687]KAF2132031.1 hypothetical protein P153DRAFT_364484 [Dothidotthia symphoricarpi CBS 119687]